MDYSPAKAELKRYLQDARDAVCWKLDGLSEYDMRRPMVPTATNLLGIVKHLAGVEIGYFGLTFGRDFDGELPWDDDDPQADMYAAADETSAEILELYRRAWTLADATIDQLPLEAIGRVPWWPEGRQEVTLHHVLVRCVGETNRHAGHADILRELIDGGRGWLADRTNLPSEDPAFWDAYRDRVERVAREASGNWP